ncbi:hypothetical protein OG889_29550 [Streptomyces sp. NBC_00481]|uniref:hypothetical protein n=1 Tax=Streptomyces sp. NBC_00481 TaxID=2975755 RepID=UPI002DDAF1E7|nr:hypothetical protein [Streptomyces sp. NBC_00481]WRY98484.1 hypothetical protein OG889_29550 [Streptomyces sp. NBC_00481]
MAARDESRRDAEYDDIAQAGAAHGDAERDGAAGGDVAHGDVARGGAKRGDAERDNTEHGDLASGNAGRGAARADGDGDGDGDGDRDDARRDGGRGDGDGERGEGEHGDAARGDSAAGDLARGDSAAGDLARGGTVSGDLARRDGERDGSVVDGAERDGPAHGGGRGAGSADGDLADGDLAYDGPAYAGMDALMAALLDEPLPEDALRDAEFVASRDAAVVDIELLREQLGLIGEALAVAGEDAVAGAPPGRPVAARPGDAAGAETDPGRVSGPAPAPVASVRPLPPRPSRARRALRITFGTLAAAAAASVVLGVGWVVVQAGGGVTASDSGASEKSLNQEDGDHAESGAGGDSGSLSKEGYVACARLIVEGTVTEVEPVTGAPQDRITVEVDRWLKPDKGADRIVFPMDHDVDPRLKKGDHVLVGIPRDDTRPDIWTTKEADIARDRAWIEAALPGSKGLSCD